MTLQPNRLTTQDDTTLISSKNRGGLIQANPIIDNMCLVAEKALRAVVDTVGLPENCHKLAVSRALTHIYLNSIHMSVPCATHTAALAKTVVERYILIRLRYETTKVDSDAKTDNMRQRLSRLILFSHV